MGRNCNHTARGRANIKAARSLGKITKEVQKRDNEQARLERLKLKAEALAIRTQQRLDELAKQKARADLGQSIRERDKPPSQKRAETVMHIRVQPPVDPVVNPYTVSVDHTTGQITREPLPEPKVERVHRLTPEELTERAAGKHMAATITSEGHLDVGGVVSENIRKEKQRRGPFFGALEGTLGSPMRVTGRWPR
jgi:hypothetical protein